MSPAQHPDNIADRNGARVSEQLLETARADREAVLQALDSRIDGLSQREADSRLQQYGLNEIAREKHQSVLMRLLSNIKNPLVLLLTALGVISFLTDDLRAAMIIFMMVVLGVVLRFYQEMRADNAAEKLKAMVSNTARGCVQARKPKCRLSYWCRVISSGWLPVIWSRRMCACFTPKICF